MYEYRKCSGMGGVSVTGHVSSWYVWSTGNVVVKTIYTNIFI